MKRLLFQFDTDPFASVFDTVVGYDGGADHISSYAGVTPENVQALVEGTIFTRAPKDKKNTAIFVGGSNMVAGEALLKKITTCFFQNFRVSVMLDSNGSNTTAAAGVTKILSSGSVKGKKAIVLAGTGPVGMRAAAMLAMEGAEVSLSSRNLQRARDTSDAIKKQFDLTVHPVEGIDHSARSNLIKDSQIVFSCGKAGVELLGENDWKENTHIEIMADANATPPLGIGGVDMLDKGEKRHHAIAWGAIGFGTLKLALHRFCIDKLFQSNDIVLDAVEIFTLAKEYDHTNV